MKGLANRRYNAMPTPIMVTASSRPATINIFTCSVGIISGWRAEPSRKRPPRIPKPIAVPSAPAPIRIATAICKLPNNTDSSIFSPWRTVETLVMLDRHAHIDDGQHHEDECLERNDQNMKQRPR